jgi:hypothetical protein
VLGPSLALNLLMPEPQPHCSGAPSSGVLVDSAFLPWIPIDRRGNGSTFVGSYY